MAEWIEPLLLSHENPTLGPWNSGKVRYSGSICTPGGLEQDGGGESLKLPVHTCTVAGSHIHQRFKSDYASGNVPISNDKPNRHFKFPFL